MTTKLSTDPYKGTRDFYPDEMAVQRYIFETWAQTAASFGYERYDASILEPAELYKSKGAENEEIVNEQTYTFTDRGEREVTLRPEMTPTAARMVAKKQRELSFPVRWYAIPNLFRYERPQRGRLREHWQLNCDIFGVDDYAADVEIIFLAYHTLRAFGADPSTFEIRVSDRSWINAILEEEGLSDDKVRALIALLDRKDKIDTFEEEAEKIAGKPIDLDRVPESSSRLARVVDRLKELNVVNVTVAPSVVRGFDYYTGIVFEIFDTSGENTRALGGGGRYDNLTALFGGNPVPGVGFGMGDVTVRDFLETHNLLTANITAPTLMVIPTSTGLSTDGQNIAQTFREAGMSAAVDFTDRKVGKKISAADDALVAYALVFGEDELASESFTLKNLTDGSETSGTIDELISAVT